MRVEGGGLIDFKEFRGREVAWRGVRVGMRVSMMGF